MNVRPSIVYSLSAILLVLGCSTPQKASVVKGPYIPINTILPSDSENVKSQIFDIRFQGSAHDALIAIHKKQQSLHVLPPKGRERPTKISLDLKQVSTESAIKILAMQGGSTFEITYKKNPVENTETAFVQFK